MKNPAHYYLVSFILPDLDIDGKLDTGSPQVHDTHNEAIDAILKADKPALLAEVMDVATPCGGVKGPVLKYNCNGSGWFDDRAVALAKWQNLSPAWKTDFKPSKRDYNCSHFNGSLHCPKGTTIGDRLVINWHDGEPNTVHIVVEMKMCSTPGSGPHFITIAEENCTDYSTADNVFRLA